VAITRARAHLLVVGDRGLWTARGGIGVALASAADSSATSFADGGDDMLLSRLYELTRTVPDSTTELLVPLDGYRADAVVSDGSGSTAVLLGRRYCWVEVRAVLSWRTTCGSRWRDRDCCVIRTAVEKVCACPHGGCSTTKPSRWSIR
jgi:hypothetical protein